MIKKIWTWKRISSVIILPMVIFILVSSLRLAVLAGEVQVALMFVAALIFFTYLFVGCAYPKRFACMKIVKRYLSFRELKDFIEKEKFNRFVMEDISDPFDFYYSENWFFVKGVYVPRKIVLDIIAVNKSLFSPFTVIGIITENGEAVFLAQVKKEEADQVTIKLKKEFPEFRCDVQILREAIYKRFYKEKKRQFADKIPDKMEFINYCRL